MLSRTADNLYWLARYVERAEYLARILEVTQRLRHGFRRKEQVEILGVAPDPSMLLQGEGSRNYIGNTRPVHMSKDFAKKRMLLRRKVGRHGTANR